MYSKREECACPMDDMYVTSSPTLSCSLEQAFGKYRDANDNSAVIVSKASLYDPGTELDENESLEIYNFLNRKVLTSNLESPWSDYHVKKNKIAAARARKRPSFWQEVVNCFFK